MSDDPFDDIDPDDREGDPFDDLEDSVATDATDEDPESPPTGSDPDEAEPVGSGETDDPRLAEDPFTGADAEELSSGGPRNTDDPDAFGEAGGRRRRREKIEVDDPFADFDVRPEEDAFEGGDWDASDVDDVWQDLSTVTEPDATTEEEGPRRYSEVNKHSFCEQCPYFSGPPDIACGHEGTEILRFLDMETVEVVDCPVVEEREELGAPGNWQ